MLEKRVVHDCQKPNISDTTADHRWTCPKCRAEWKYYGSGHTRKKKVGRWPNRKTEVIPDPGFWMCNELPEEWREVVQSPGTFPFSKR